LQYDTAFIEPIPFTANDWEIVKRNYNKWRSEELKKGNYQKKCSDDGYDGSIALPKIPKKFQRDNDMHYNEGYIYAYG
jgi:hypothetical protein